MLSGLLKLVRPTRPLGERGEALAARHLRSKGLKILMCNYRAAGGEIDIVAREGDVLVFVEVKTRRSDQYTPPHRQVDLRKQRNLTRAARAYLSHYRNHQPRARFDVISIVWSETGEPRIEHLVNAFEAAF